MLVQQAFPKRTSLRHKGNSYRLHPNSMGPACNRVLLGQTDSNLFFDLDDGKECNAYADDQQAINEGDRFRSEYLLQRWCIRDGELSEGNHCDGHPHDLGASNALPGKRCAVEIANEEQMEYFHHD